MKRFTLTLLTLFAVSTFSIGQFTFGAGVSILDFDAVGIQGKLQMDLEEQTGQPLDGAGTFTYYLGEIRDWSIDLDAHYRLMVIGDNIEFDPVAGIQIARSSVDGFGGNTDLGLNLGGNFTVPMESFTVYIQPKIVIGGFDAFTIGGGILF